MNRTRRKRRIQKFFITLRGIELPFLRGVGLYDVLRFFLNGLTDPHFTLMAASMAYYFFFSFIPGLILIFLLLPYIPVDGIQEFIADYLYQIVPEAGYALVENIVEGSFTRPGTAFEIIFFGLLILRGSTLGIIAMMKAFTKTEEIFKKRNVFQMYRDALVIFMILVLLFALAVAFQLAGGHILAFLRAKELIRSGVQSFLFNALRFGISFGMLLISISFIYYIGPAVRKRWKFFTPGSLISAILTFAAILGLSYFFNNFANYNKIYGSLAAIVILLVWYYWISMMLLIGFELNAAIDLAVFHRRKFRAEPPVKEMPKKKAGRKWWIRKKK